MAKITRFSDTPVCPDCHHSKRIDPIAKEETMTQDKVADEELAELVRRTAEAAKAYIRGDMRTYFALIRYGDDNTLMSPFGGEPSRGSEVPSPERLEALERYFQGGEAELEVVESYASGDLAVLVVIERQAAGSAGCRSRTGRSG